MINLINGLVNYPYYDILLNGPLDQIEKVPKVIAILKGMGIEIGYNLIFSVWLVLRPFKGFLFEVLYCYGGAYLIFCWYVNDPKKGFKILVDSVGISILFIFIYSYLIEVPYLAGNSFSKNVLAAINPYIHVVEKNGLWWPPLLWNNQLRSVFVEPSYFGIYASFAVPILWYRIIKSRVVLWAPITCLMTFLLFLTKSRTSFLLHLGELLAFVIIGLFVLKIKEYSKRILVIVLCSIVSFAISNLFIQKYMSDMNANRVASMESISSNLKGEITNYIDSNVVSLADSDKRSNRARYSIMAADFKIGLNHPFLGVGWGLRNAYIPSYLSEKGKSNPEIKMWLDFANKLGYLRFTFPYLGEYTNRFCEIGILGLIFYLLPAFLLINNLVKSIIDYRNNYRIENVVILVSFIGIMTSGIGDTFNITYCYWVLMGLGYAMCFGKAADEKDVNERT